MIQSREMKSRSKVTKRQKVLLTAEMHVFSPASYDSSLAFRDPTPRPFSRESALLLHRLSMSGHAPCPGSALPPAAQYSVGSQSGTRTGLIGYWSSLYPPSFLRRRPQPFKGTCCPDSSPRLITTVMTSSLPLEKEQRKRREYKARYNIY